MSLTHLLCRELKFVAQDMFLKGGRAVIFGSIAHSCFGGVHYIRDDFTLIVSAFTH